MKFSELKQLIQSDLVTLVILEKVEKFGEDWKEKRFWDEATTHMKITKDHQYDDHYVDAILSENDSENVNTQPVLTIFLVPPEKYDEYCKNQQYFIESDSNKKGKDLQKEEKCQKK